MASPQLENGYTRVANELLEAVYKHGFTGNQLRIVLWIFRFTYGMRGRKITPVPSRRKLAVDLNEEARGITKAFNLLITNNVLVHVGGDLYRLNKDYETWRGENSSSHSNENYSSHARGSGENCSSQNENSSAQKREPPFSPPHTPPLGNKERKTKDTSAGVAGRDDESTGKPTPEKLMRLWNKMAPEPLPRVEILSATRDRWCRARLKDFPDPNFWIAAMDRIKGSSFLQGKGRPRKDGERPFRATFDWLIKNDNNVAKVMEGQYDDEPARN